MTAGHIVVVPHTHWDREWYRTHEAFRSRLIDLLDALLPLLENDPGFRHFTLDGQTIVLEDYLEVRPEARERIAKLVGAGRLVVGPWYVLPDEWLVSGEALIRNLRVGIGQAQRFGRAMELGYVPDQFGHVGQLPQIFAGFGIDLAVLWRGVGAGLDETLFDWEAPDGSRVRTLHLVGGYGNGAHLPREPEALARRLRAEVDSQAERSRIDAYLIMNGSDHLAPLPELPAALAAALPMLAGDGEVSVAIGTLLDFAERVRSEAPAGLPVHRGELRSGLRSPILAGCASARLPQKRADFHNDRRLTRYLEPLAAWLTQLGGDGDPGRLDWLWRKTLENHPHDSICGCSIDAVHDQVDARFTQVAQAAEAQLARVEGALVSQLEDPRPPATTSIAVWNPHIEGVAEAEGEVELAFEAPHTPLALHVRDLSGRRIPATGEWVTEGRVYAEYRLPARVAAGLVRGFPPEFFGQPVCAAHVHDGGVETAVDIWLGDRETPGFDWEHERSTLAADLAARGDRPTAFRPRQRGRVRLRFTDRFPGHGVRRYHVAAGEAEGGSSLRAWTTDGGAGIENPVWRIEVAADGRVRCHERRRGITLEDAIWIASEADRGDTYSFDPVIGDDPVTRPAEVHVAASATTSRAELVVDAVYRVPEALASDRRSRSRATVELPVRTTIALVADLDRVELDVRVENRARDHRLRLHVRAPEPAVAFEVESAFEIAERPIDPAADAFGSSHPAELPDGASPQRSFATWRGRDHALSVANRGAAEVAATRVPVDSVAVSLLRAVGWLSRDDLARRPVAAGPPLETPGAQVPGPHRIELAFRLHDPHDPQRVVEAHRYAAPPRVLGGAGTPDGKLRDAERLVEIEDPALVVSALEPTAEGTLRLRVWNASAVARSATLRVRGDAPLQAVDLRDRPLATSPLTPAPGQGWELALGAWAFTTLRIGKMA